MTPQDEQKAQALMKQYKYTPPASSGQTLSWDQQVQQKMQPAPPAEDTADNPQSDGQGATFSAVGGAIGDDFNKRADNVGKIEGSSDNIASKTLQIGGEGFGAVSDAVGDVVKSAIKPEVLKAIGTHLAPLVESAQKSPAGKAVLDWFGGLSPETQRNLGATGSIASLLSNAIGAGGAKEVATEGIDLGINEATKSAMQPLTDAAQSAVAPVKDAAANALGKTKEAIKPTMSPEEASAQVVQGKTEDTAAAHRTLSSLDTTGVKTYADLQAKIKAEIKPLASKVDAELAKDTNPAKTTAEFEKSVGEGEGAVKVNYVQRAMDDLKTFYQKTGDAAGESKIKTLAAKADKDGLNAKEVNDLARLHGSTINAFNANGEAASGLTKQAAENTRTGLKDIARESLGGDAAKALDAKLSDLYDTQALVDKQVEKVHSQVGKTPKQGILPKVVSGVIKTADAVTGSPLKAIGREMGTLGSKGEMSALEIEKNLPKNLKTITKAAKAKEAAATAAKEDAANIGARQSVAGSKVARPLNSGHIKIGSGDLKNIHDEDLGTMKDFTDYVAGDYKPAAKEAEKLEGDATTIWEHYFPGRKLPKDLNGIATHFGKVLEKKGYK